MHRNGTDVVEALPTIHQTLDEAARKLAGAGLPSPRLDARLLLGTVLDMSKEAVMAHENECISWDARERMDGLVDRRCGSEPVAYLRGVKEFWSLELDVTPAVLIPRPDTESLVEACLRAMALVRAGTWAVDVGTGSGAVALALAHAEPSLSLLALDVSTEALAVARTNVRKHAMTGRVIPAAGDLLAPLRQGLESVACIAANLPYIATDEIPDLDPGIRDHEPRLAIDGGPDGLALVRRLVDEAPSRLAPGGLIALEVADHRATEVASMLGSSGPWHGVRLEQDLGRLKRVVTARRRAG